MKLGRHLIGAMMVCLLATVACSQERKEAQAELNSISKEVIMQDENGVKTLTITTKENGVKSEEVFTGAAAEAKMAEMESGMETSSESESTNISKKESKEVEVIKEDGVSKVTIKTTRNGIETVEKYEGEEAEDKIQELEAESAPEQDGEKKIVIKKRKELKSGEGDQ